VLAAGIGVTVSLPAGMAPLAALLGESPSRVLLAVEPSSAGELEALAEARGVPAVRLGATGGGRLAITGVLDLDLEALRRRYEGAIPSAVGAEPG
jgi:phosphoribosylformylglycinamidine (FGAM) synthase-like enzyme